MDKVQEDNFHEILNKHGYPWGCVLCLPQPIYDYPRKLILDPQTTAHEKLWNDLLKGLYTSPLHKKLADTPEFKKQINILTKY